MSLQIANTKKSALKSYIKIILNFGTVDYLASIQTSTRDGQFFQLAFHKSFVKQAGQKQSLGCRLPSDRQVRKQLGGGTITGEMQRQSCQSVNHEGRSCCLENTQGKGGKEQASLSGDVQQRMGQRVMAWVRYSATFQS